MVGQLGDFSTGVMHNVLVKIQYKHWNFEFFEEIQIQLRLQCVVNKLDDILTTVNL